jgi:ArsR family transcriptional regulator
MTIESAAERFSALGDPIRLRILDELTDGQRCVCELLEEIGIAPNLLSYHLRVLRDAGLVTASRRGRWVDYRLAAEGLDALRDAIPVLREA